MPQPIPEPAVLYSVVLRSAAPPVLFKHPRTRGAGSGSSQCFTAGGIEELLTALEWDVYRLIRSRLDPFYLLHAGAVAQGGVGWILYAPSGGGKSTLVAGLLSRGFQYLSDEITILDPRSRTILPFPKALSFEEEPLHLCLPPGAGVERVTRQMEGKRWRVWQIDPASMGPVLPPPGASFPVRFLVRVAYDPKGRSCLTGMPKARTVMELLKGSFNFDRHHSQGVDLLVRLAEECECLSLSMNGLEEAVDLLWGHQL